MKKKETKSRFTGYLLLHESEICDSKFIYRGVDRKIPDYSQDYLQQELWIRSANAGWNGERSLFIKRLQDAELLFEEYIELDIKLDLIEVNLVVSEQSAEEAKSRNDNFLGFDVATWGCNSAILDHPVAWDEEKPFLDSKSSEEIAWPLWRLQGLYFAPQLNINGLLNKFEDANLFLSVEKTLGTLFPAFYEYDVNQLRVFSIHLIESNI